MTTARRITAGLLLPAILSVSALRAGDTVDWDDLPQIVGSTATDRDFTVVTKTGETQHSRTLLFTPAGVDLTKPDRSVPREQITEIRIRHRVPWKDAFLLPIGIVIAPAFIFGGPTGVFGEVVTFIILAPVALAVGIPAAPFVAVIEGGKRLAPARVIKVAP